MLDWSLLVALNPIRNEMWRIVRVGDDCVHAICGDRDSERIARPWRDEAWRCLDFREKPALRQTLWRNVEMLREGLRAVGFDLGPSQSQILPLLLYDQRRTMAACRFLLRRGAFVQGIRPPTVPPGTARLRITPMASHTEADLRAALAAFENLQSLLQVPKRRAAIAVAAASATVGVAP